jgi:SnoaL-like domain/Cupin domain
MSTTNGRMHHNEMPERSRDQAAGERGKTLLVVTLCLAVAASVTLLNIGIALSDPGVVASNSRPVEANAKLARDFYTAINDAIRTGDDGDLNSIVTPDFAWCLDCPGQSTTREGLKRYLISLHRTAPDARLAVDSVVAGEDIVAARVRVTSYSLVGEPVLWGPLDTLRIAGGLIAERRNGPDGITLAEPLLRARFDSLPPAVTGVAMARLIFPLGSGMEGLLSPGPTILVVESGAIAVRIACCGRVVRAGSVETSMGNGATTLHQGDAAIIPSGKQHAFQQEGTEPAVAVGVTLYFVDIGIEGSVRREPEVAPFSPVSSIATTSMLAPTVQILRGGAMGAWPSGPVDLALGRAILGPGARLIPPANESILLAIEAGTLDLTGLEDRTVFAGNGIAQPSGTVRELRNNSEGLVIFLIFTVSPATD